MEAPTTSSILTFAALLGVTLAGCSTQVGFEGVFHDRETVTYELSDAIGKVGPLALDLRWNGTFLDVGAHSSLSISNPETMVPPMSEHATARFDARTGEQLWTRQPTATFYPLGIDRWVPVASSFYGWGYDELAISAGDFIPVGLRIRGIQGLTNDSALEFDYFEDDDGWRAFARVECQYKCGHFEWDSNKFLGAAFLNVTMEGRAGEILPRIVTWKWDGSKPAELAMVEVSRSSSEQATGFPPSQAVAPDVAVGTCGIDLCEPKDWPMELSLRAGLEALQATPEWEAWRGNAPEQMWRARLVRGERTLLGYPLFPVKVTDQLLWSFGFAKPAEEVATIFGVRTDGNINASLWAPISFGGMLDVRWDFRGVESVPPLTSIETVLSVATANGLPTSDLGALDLVIEHELKSPGLAYRAMAIMIDREHHGRMWVSAVTGQPWFVKYPIASQ